MSECNVWQKIAECQKELMSMELPKSGYNSFGKFHYHELEDLLPAIQQVTYEKSLLLEFTFTEKEAILKVRDWSNPERTISNMIPLPPIKELKTMNLVQSLGSYITYLKRYLLTNTFLITEKSVIDSTNMTKLEKKLEGVTHSKDFNTADQDKPLSDYTNATTCISAIKKWIEEKGRRVTNERIKKRAFYLYKNKGKIDGAMYHEIKKICEGEESV